jgi:hypothetical protein
MYLILDEIFKENEYIRGVPVTLRICASTLGMFDHGLDQGRERSVTR